MKTSVLILLLSFTYDVHARIGMGEISFPTPYGHDIVDGDPYANTPVLVGYENTIHSLDRWYFYHGYIVGQGKNYFFIFNEITNDLAYFTNQQEWRAQIEQKRLEPLYTRWCEITDSPNYLLMALILSSLITIPIFLIVLFFVIGLTYVKMIIWNRKTWTVVSVFTVFVGTFILYHLNIHSF